MLSIIVDFTSLVIVGSLAGAAVLHGNRKPEATNETIQIVRSYVRTIK